MKRARALGGTLAVTVLLSAACGDGGSTAPETATRVVARVIPVAPSPTPAPTATPAQEPSTVLSESELAALVVATESVESTFPGLRLNAQDSSLLDSPASPVMGESSGGLAAQGRVGGHSNEYRNLLVLFDPESQATSPFFVSSTVDLFDKAESARLYLDRRAVVLASLIGRGQDVIVVEEIVEIEAPELGEDVVAAHLDAVVIGFEIDFDGTLIAWTRGRVVAVLVVLGAGGQTWEEATEAAARKMDSLIESSEALR